MEIGYMPVGELSGHEAGRRLLEKMYKELTGAPVPEICIGERGKPYFAGGGLHFSITHTKRHVFCVLSEKPVGIDAEETDRQVDLRLAEKILSPAEKAQYDKATEKEGALLRFWVLKEAAGKLTGAGINGYPNKTEFSLDDPRVTESHGCYVAVVESDK